MCFNQIQYGCVQRTNSKKHCICVPLLTNLTVFLSYPLFFEQPGQKHYPDHHACWDEADCREQTSQLCHSTTAPAASAAKTGHTG